MATRSSILAWRIPMNTRARQATVHGVAKSQTGLTRYLARTYAHPYPFLLFFSYLLKCTLYFTNVRPLSTVNFKYFINLSLSFDFAY